MEPSWRDVVEALEQMEENSLANKIRRLFWQDFAGSKCYDNTDLFRLVEGVRA